MQLSCPHARGSRSKELAYSCGERFARHLGRRPARLALPVRGDCRIGRRYHEDMRPCISEACTMPSTFAEDVAALAQGGCAAMEVWLTKLETHLETHSVADTRKLLDDRGVSLAA